jgi:hypothetical protein
VVYYRRQSGGIETEVRDYFSQTGPVERSWSWVYEPGEPIDVLVRYRGALWRRTATANFPTSSSADIVILMDTTGTMHRSINLLQERCVDFSRQLAAQQLKHRFALVGFGDTSEEPWLDVHPFTDDAQDFQGEVAKLERFDGGDLQESCLDAIEEALQLPFEPDAMRRFYLVTDAEFKPPRSGATPAELAERLAKEQVMLSVFSREEYRSQYEPLLAGVGRFQEIEDFGQVLTEGRILED